MWVRRMMVMDVYCTVMDVYCTGKEKKWKTETAVDGQHEGRYDREGTARGGKCKAL